MGEQSIKFNFRKLLRKAPLPIPLSFVGGGGGLFPFEIGPPVSITARRAKATFALNIATLFLKSFKKF